MIRIAIFHYHAIELFPPVMNLVNYLSENGKNEFEIRVYTTNPAKKFSRFENVKYGNVTIVRAGRSAFEKNVIVRYAKFIWHFLFTLVDCIFWSPRKLMYLDSVSAMVPVLLKKTVYGRRPLFIHYHEYMSPADYERSPLMGNLYKLEKSIYNKSAWISHTNLDRLNLFLSDLNSTNKLRVHVMPNYPPSSWGRQGIGMKRIDQDSVRIIYVGAIDLETMYLPEFIRWVEKHAGKCSLDIFSNQDTAFIESYLEKEGAKHVHVRSPRSYFELPDVLNNYDVGVILYKDIYVNFIYNAPNKLFEYLACKLDVWFPLTLKGVLPYIRTEFYPRVVGLDFSNLDKYDPLELIEVEDLLYKPTGYFCENVYNEIKGELLQVF